MAQNQIFRGTARSIVDTPSGREYRYHNTAVVKTSKCGKYIWLDSGGYRTATTKMVMNQASHMDNLGFRVSQRYGEWHVWFGERVVEFKDNMMLHR